MDDSHTTDASGDGDAIATEAAFRAALGDAIRAADANGVDVRGGWSVATDDAAWDVEITALRRPTVTATVGPEGPVHAVVTAVAGAEGVEPTALPPLQSAISPSLLEATLDEAAAGTRSQVSFEYAGYRVTVRSDGTVAVEE